MTEFLQDPIQWIVGTLALTFLITGLVTGITCGVAFTIATIKNFPDLL